MTSQFDKLFPWLTVLAFALVAVAYSVRVLIRGRVRFDRVDQQGSSPFLSKSLMEMGYWGMQPLAQFAIKAKLSATAVSWISFCFGAAAGFCLADGHFGSAGLLATVAGILDAVDGMVARMTGTSSKSGKVLDSTLDRYVEFFFLGGLMIYYRQVPMVQVLTLLALFGSFMVSYSTALAEIHGIQIKGGSMRRPDRMVYMISGAILSSFTIPRFELESGYPVPLGYPMVLAIAIIAVVANISAFERCQATRRLLSDPTLGK